MGPTILVVEPDPMSRKWMRQELEAASYQVVEAADGPGALDAMARRRSQLVILNPEFLDADSQNWIARLRSLAAVSGTPIVALGRRSAASPKSADPSELLKIARGLLPGRDSASQPPAGEAVDDRATESLARWESDIGVLSGLLQALRAGSGADAVHSELLQRFLSSTGVGKSAAYLLDAQGDFVLRALLGFAGGGERSEGSSRAGEGPADFFGHAKLLRQTIATGRSLAVPSAKAPAEHARDVLAKAGVACLLIVPLVLGEERFGALVMSPAGGELSEEWIREAETLASRFGEAVQLARAISLLQQNEQQLERMVQTLAEGLLITDRQRRFTFANEAAGRILGSPVAQILQSTSNHTPWKLTTPEGEALAPEDYPITQVLRTGAPLHKREVGVVRPDGRRVILSVNSAPLRDPEGNITGTVSSLTDITRHRQQAEQLARKNTELEQFAYVVAHDLKEPLRTVMSFTQLLRQRCRECLDPRAGGYIERAIGGAQRMQELIDDLLAYARVGTRESAPQAVESETVFCNALANLQAAVEASGADVTCDPLPVVTADPREFGQVFENLIGNALKYRSEASPQVRVWAEREGDQWIFSVRDNGIGIDPRHAERIFQVFQRLHAKTEYPGTGIGLATCKKIIEAHGGRIWVESARGEGSTFRFTLPVGKSATA